jgi:hypothetical protein
MNARNLPEGEAKLDRRVRLTNSPPSVCLLPRKCGRLDISELCGPPLPLPPPPSPAAGIVSIYVSLFELLKYTSTSIKPLKPEIYLMIFNKISNDTP